MKFFIVHAHPEPNSFNAALTRMAAEKLPQHGHEVVVSDLYAMRFNPVSDRRNFTTVSDADFFKQQAEETYATANDGFAADIEAELEKLDWCDVLILQFPLWWFSVPAIMKGWIDKVFAMERIYGGSLIFENGYFAGKRAMASVSTGGSAEAYSPDTMGAEIDQVLYPIHFGVLRFVGFDVIPPFMSWSASKVTQPERAQYLEEYLQKLLVIADIDPIPFRLTTEYAPITEEC